MNTQNSMNIESSTLEQQLKLFPQFKSSEVIQAPDIPAEGLISELLSESNFEDVTAGAPNVKENLKNMLIQMQQQQLITSFNSSIIDATSRAHNE